MCRTSILLPSTLTDVNISPSSRGTATRFEYRAKPTSTGPIPPNQMEVTVHTHSDLYSDSSASKDMQLHDKSQGTVVVNGDVESGNER